MKNLFSSALPSALSASAITNGFSRQVPGRVLALAQGFGSFSMLTVAKGALALMLLAGMVVAGAAAFLPSPQQPPPNPVVEPAAKPKVELKLRLDALGDPVPGYATARLGSLRLFHGFNPVSRVVLSPDGKYVVSVVPMNNKLWDATTGKELPLDAFLQRAFIFTAKGKLLASQARPLDFRLYDPVTGKQVVEENIDIGAEQKKVDPKSTAVLSPDGRIYASWNVVDIYLVDAVTRKELPPLEDQLDHTVLSVSFSPDGKLLAACYDGPKASVRVWDVATRKVIARLQAKDYRVFHASFSADNKTLAAADCYGVTLWDVTTGKWLHDFGHTFHQVCALAFTPDGQTVITGGASSDKVIRLWDPLTGKERGQWLGHEQGLTGIAVSPDGKTAAVGSHPLLRLVDVKTGKETARLGGKEIIWSVAFAPDGKLLASGGEEALRLWDMATGKEVRSFDEAKVLRLAFSPDGKYLAAETLGRKNVRLWEVATGREVHQFDGRGKTLSFPAFSPDGAVIAAGDSEGLIRQWDVASGRELPPIGEPVNPEGKGGFYIGGLRFSPDGRTVAAGYSDHTVRLWERASGKKRIGYYGHRGGLMTLAFSPDGSLLASGGTDRTAIVWDVTGRYTDEPYLPKEPAGWWNALAGADAVMAYRGIRKLTVEGNTTVPFLKEHLRPAVAADPKVVERLLKDLDSDDFSTREKASKDLLTLGEAAEWFLRQAAASDLSAEARRRVERLLTQFDPVIVPERLRGPRAVEILEYIATQEAAKFLQELAEGDPKARLTREAKAALGRMIRH